jgi:predicted site-specific integrase-resolvase
MAPSSSPAYRPLVEACKEHGISRTVAYELIKDNLIETFKLGAKRYVIIESLRTLPDRLRGKAA